MTVGTQPATSPVDYVVRQAILDALDSGYERWHCGEFGFLENLISPSPPGRTWSTLMPPAG